jgi:hypothetical protein
VIGEAFAQAGSLSDPSITGAGSAFAAAAIVIARLVDCGTESGARLACAYVLESGINAEITTAARVRVRLDAKKLALTDTAKDSFRM